LNYLVAPAPDNGYVYAFTNRARATAVSSTWFDAVPFQSHRIDGWLRGQFAGYVGGGYLWLEYYNGSHLTQRIPLWQANNLNNQAVGVISLTPAPLP
jgi:hypothetical protein